MTLYALHLHAGCQRYLSETGRKKNKEKSPPWHKWRHGLERRLIFVVHKDVGFDTCRGGILSSHTYGVKRARPGLGWRRGD